MLISADVLNQAWAWAGGGCQCKQPGHHHAERCDAKLVFTARGSMQQGGWDYRFRVPLRHGGSVEAEDIEVLCVECYLLLSFEQAVTSEQRAAS